MKKKEKETLPNIKFTLEETTSGTDNITSNQPKTQLTLFQKSLDNCNQLLKYFSNDADSGRISNAQYSSTRFNNKVFKKKMKLLKATLKPPNRIIGEVREKFDINLKLKTVPETIDSNLITPRSEISRRLISSTVYQEPFESSNQTMNRNKTSSTSHYGSFTSDLKNVKKYQSRLQITDLVNVLSLQNKSLTNQLLKEFITYFSETFPEEFEEFKSTLAITIDKEMIISENKQIQFFVIVLEKLYSTIHRMSNQSDIHFNLKLISLYDSFLKDFCNHLSVSSLYRANFVQKIIGYQFELVDKIYNSYKEEIEKREKAISALLAKQVQTNQILEKLSKDKFELSEKNNEIVKEIEMLKHDNESKDLEIKKLTENVLEKSKEIELKETKLNEIVNKFNIKTCSDRRRNNPFNQDQAMIERGLSDIEETNEGNKEDDEVVDSAKQLNIQKTKPKLYSKQKDSRHMSDKREKDKATLGSKELMKMDMNYLIENRKKRASLSVNKRKLSFRNSTELSKKVDITKKRNTVLNIQSTFGNQIQKSSANIQLGSPTRRGSDNFNLYITKGIDLNKKDLTENSIQTDISLMDFAEIFEKNKIMEDTAGNFNTQIENINSVFETLQQILSKKTEGKASDDHEIEDTINQGQLYGKNMSLCSDGLAQNIRKMIAECDLLLKENENLRENYEKISDEKNDIKETYSEIFENLVKNITGTNETLNNFLTDENNKNLTYEKVFEVMNGVMAKNEGVINQDDDVLCSLLENKCEIKREIKIKLPGLKKTIEKKVEAKHESEIPGRKSLSKGIISEFSTSTEKIKTSMNLKKLLKIIETIYFEWIERIYFKKDKTNLNFAEQFVAFSDLPYIYFNNHFGLTSLARKKYRDFLSSLAINQGTSKRISLFVKLMKIQDGDNSLSLFATRQIILFIQNVKVGKIIQHFSSVNDGQSVEPQLQLGLIYSKMPSILNGLISKFPSQVDEIKKQIEEYLDKNKFSQFIHMRNYVLVDFDDFLEFFSNVITTVEARQNEYLKIIFNAIDIEEKGFFNQLDFAIAFQYVLAQNFQKTLLENDNTEFAKFSAICIENQFANTDLFDKFFMLNNPEEIIEVLSFLSEDLHGNSLTIIDNFKKRLHAMNDNPRINILHNKLNSLREKIKNATFNKENQRFNDAENENKLEASIYWLALQVFDRISKDIYNEAKINVIFQNEVLEIFQTFEDHLNFTEIVQDNVVLKCLKN